MNYYKNFITLIREYWEIRKILVITNLISGALLLVYPFLAENKDKIIDSFDAGTSSIISLIVIILIPVIVDFISFSMKGYARISASAITIYSELKNTIKIKNAFLTHAALSRINNEISIIRDLNNNCSRLPSLQNYEYMRRIFTRTLSETMQTGDHYITLSNIDFWAMTPKENLTEFIEQNMKAIKLGKHIHRIVVLDKDKYFSGNDSGLDNTEVVKKMEFEKYIREINAKFIPHDGKTSYYDDFKTLCYMSNSDLKRDNDNYFPSVIVVNKNLTNALLLTVYPTENIELENPQIFIRHFEFPKISVRKVNGKIDVIDLLEKIASYYREHEVNDRESQNEINTFRLVLDIYLKIFGELRQLYNLQTGAKHQKTDGLDLMDIPSMLKILG